MWYIEVYELDSPVRKDYYVRARMTKEMLDLINESAIQLGLSQSEFVRQAVWLYVLILKGEKRIKIRNAKRKTKDSPTKGS
uniref:CopG n=1 Tax=Saccharolobus solfataricus TaxID=2287 RepID=Q6PN92_SACSO|nr:ribbon-helix-helix protein, CopG family [Saccharolobus solfataricus]AAT00518.1 CopG [Saccharolobus solfataricus]